MKDVACADSLESEFLGVFIDPTCSCNAQESSHVNTSHIATGRQLELMQL